MRYLLVLQHLKILEKKAIKIIDKLKELGIKINYKDVVRIAGDGIIGRPHIARSLVQKGYVQTIEEGFIKYLAKGAPAYVPKHKLTPICAINIIRKAGGFSVVAHPGLLTSEAILNCLINMDIDGIEVYHSKHTIEQSKKYFKLAKRYNLFITGGSDFHYPPKNNEYKGDLGSIKVSLESIAKLLE